MTLGDAFEESLSAARAGAEWAWAEIYRDLAPAVLGYLRTRGAPEPEDTLAEVFLQAVQNLPRFDGGEREFRTWVLTIAHRRLVDSHRKRARSREVPEGSDEMFSVKVEGDVADQGMNRLEAERAMALIRELAPAQQEVIVLRLVADLTIDEVAHVVGKRPGAVKALQRRGLAALKKRLSEAGVSL